MGQPVGEDRPLESIAPTTRVCTVCAKTLPVEDFYVKIPATGRRMAQCSVCYNARKLAAYNERTGRVGNEDRRWQKKPVQTEKVCAMCGLLKPADAFDERSDHRGRLRSECRMCRSEDRARYKAENHDRVLIQDAAYRDANAVDLAERLRQWKLDHPESYSAIHRRAKHKRRMLIEQDGGHWTNEEWLALKHAYDYRCADCGKHEPDEVSLTVDHVIPLSKGGSNSVGNLAPRCRSCNSKKNNKII